jgi:hypothetical protein
MEILFVVAGALLIVLAVRMFTQQPEEQLPPRTGGNGGGGQIEGNGPQVPQANVAAQPIALDVIDDEV